MRAFPSITGRAPYGPMLPSPRTAEPSETIAMLFFLIDINRASSGCLARCIAAAPTPGVYQSEKSFFPVNFTLALVSIRAPCLLNIEIIFFVFVSIVGRVYYKSELRRHY